jgi:hypothetical protein
MPVARPLSCFAPLSGLVYTTAQPAKLPHRAKPYNAAGLAKSHLLPNRFIFTAIASIDLSTGKGPILPLDCDGNPDRKGDLRDQDENSFCGNEPTG